MPLPVLPTDSFFRCVNTCMRVVLNQTKNGCLVFRRLAMNFLAAPETPRRSSACASVLSGPVSSIFCRLAIGPGVDNAARTELLLELRILRIEVAFRFLLGVEVVEIAEELVEAVIGRQVLVLIAQVVLAELPGRVTLRLQRIGDRRHPVRDAVRIARHADGQQAGAKRLLPEDEGRPPGGAALLAVGVREERAFLGDAIDVRRAIAHQALV